jgi:hypothetical protein
MMIWGGGFLLAIALYVIGPDEFLDACLRLLDSIDHLFRHLGLALGVVTYGAVRALAIAIYVVFAVLAVLSSQRGRHGFWALVWVTIGFLMLVWRPYADAFVPVSRWLGALLVAGAGAAVMTQRLMAPDGRRTGPVPNYQDDRGI